MLVEPFSENNLEDWDLFSKNHTLAWFWHTSHWMRYCLVSRLQVKSVNVSFMVWDIDRTILYAIVPLIIEEKDSIKEFTFGGGATPAILIEQSLNGKKEKEVESFIFTQIQLIASQEDVKRIEIKESNSYQTRACAIEPMYYKRGFMEKQMYTSVLSLQGLLSDILKNMSKGHKSSIKQSQKLEFQIDYYDYNTISKDKLYQFQQAYFKAAGKITRPTETFEKIFGFIKEGFGVLFEYSREGISHGFILVLIYKNYAYYAMSCQAKDIEEVGDSQFVHWEVIQYLVSLSIEYYELGDQHYRSNILQFVEPKLAAISQFKRGFGGDLIPQPTLEYFYDKDYLLHIWNQRIEKYVTSER